MHFETVPNRGSRPAILLRESYREDGKVKKRTLANLTDWPAEKVDDWLQGMQPHIEQKLARRHFGERCLVLYDLTSRWMEGRTCPLAKRGYSRDGKKGKLQIEFGVVTDQEGRPVAVEVFDGNTSDAKTVATQVDRIRRRFKLDRVVVVGDRGMLTDARIREDLTPHGLDWVTALRAPAIKQLRKSGVIQPSLFDEMDLAELTSPDFPGERLVACRNPLLAKERARKRRELLAATEEDLRQIANQTVLGGGRDARAAEIGMKVGAVLGRHKMKKHFDVTVIGTGLTWSRREEQIAEEAALDGLYVVRTNVDAERLDTDAVVTTYKQLANVERAFRTLKTVDLEVRPIHHRLADRVRAHVLLCMLAYYVEWEMRRRLRPLMFTDEHPAEGRAERSSPVAPALRSKSARKKAAVKLNAAGEPVRAFRGLIDDGTSVYLSGVRLAPA